MDNKKLIKKLNKRIAFWKALAATYKDEAKMWKKHNEMNGRFEDWVNAMENDRYNDKSDW